MLDLSEQISHPERTSQHACTLCACMHRPISQPNWVRIERSRYLCLSTYYDPSTQASVHAQYSLACLGPYLSEIEVQSEILSIYGIRRTCRTYLRTLYNPSMQDKSACTLCAYVHRPISKPNWVESEGSKYLWNQENMPDLLEHKI